MPVSRSLIVLPFIVSIVLLILAPLPGRAQDEPGDPGGASAGRIEGRFKLLPIPYINYDRSIGLQLGALPMAMFNPVKNDTISPSSIAGLFGMYTTNDTWFVSAFAKMFFKEDDWRTTTALGTGTYNFQFFMDGTGGGWIPYNTEMDIVYLQLQRRTYKRLYVGVSYVYLDFLTSVEGAPGPVHEKRQGLGLDLSLDARSSVYYPRTGVETTIQYFTYPTGLGNSSDSNKLDFEYNRYLSTRKDRDVIAMRLFAGVGLGDLSFNQQYVVGQRQDIRGYTQGEYRGNYMLALQGEYRWNFANRLGAVGFVGVASVFDSVNEDDDGKLLPGIGTGFRFTVDTETHANVGLDIAAGKDDWGVYFRFGEAF